MAEHKKLKAICEKIDYKIDIDLEWDCSIYDDEIDYSRDVTITEDPRVVIFTQEFMEKYWDYYRENKFSSDSIVSTMKTVLLDKYLDTPVDYLYNLLGLGEK